MDRPMTSDVRRRGEGPGRNSENGTLRPPDENRFISQNRILSDGGNWVSSQIWAGREARRGGLVRLVETGEASVYNQLRILHLPTGRSRKDTEWVKAKWNDGMKVMSACLSKENVNYLEPNLDWLGLSCLSLLSGHRSVQPINWQIGVTTRPCLHHIKGRILWK